MGGTRTARPTANGTSSRDNRSRANPVPERVRSAYRTPIPETRNSSGTPHNDPHKRKTVNPRLGRGSFTNQEAPEANTTAEWKTTSPATTNALMKSSSGRRSGRDNDGASRAGRARSVTGRTPGIPRSVSPDRADPGSLLPVGPATPAGSCSRPGPESSGAISDLGRHGKHGSTKSFPNSQGDDCPAIVQEWRNGWVHRFSTSPRPSQIVQAIAAIEDSLTTLASCRRGSAA